MYKWHVLRGQNIHFYCVHLTLLLIPAFQDGQTERVKSSKQLGFLYFTYYSLCLILKFFCFIGHKILFCIKGLEETGTKLDILKLSNKWVSCGKIVLKHLRDVSWVM